MSKFHMKNPSDSPPPAAGVRKGTSDVYISKSTVWISTFWRSTNCTASFYSAAHHDISENETLVLNQILYFHSVDNFFPRLKTGHQSISNCTYVSNLSNLPRLSKPKLSSCISWSKRKMGKLRAKLWNEQSEHGSIGWRTQQLQMQGGKMHMCLGWAQAQARTLGSGFY
jgi:hypothetical protein